MEDVSLIEQDTIGQSDNIKWWRNKKGRITASKCKDCIGKGNPTRIIKRIITVGKPHEKPRSLHMKYGIDNEDIACDKFVTQLISKNISVDLRKCGLFISTEHGELAASPDRVGEIEGQKVVVEVKCLSASRDLTPRDAVVKKQKESNFAFRMQNECVVLKERHQCFHQVQMQMAVTKCYVAYFVIFTNT